ncbi:hypothetical protein [Genomoviridae sp.]|nr:hypothetical protein [Genomoviridae sp.]
MAASLSLNLHNVSTNSTKLKSPPRPHPAPPKWPTDDLIPRIGQKEEQGVSQGALLIPRGGEPM